MIRDAERENILLEWDLGVPEEEAVAAVPVEPTDVGSTEPAPSAEG